MSFIYSTCNSLTNNHWMNICSSFSSNHWTNLCYHNSHWTNICNLFTNIHWTNMCNSFTNNHWNDILKIHFQEIIGRTFAARFFNKLSAISNNFTSNQWAWTSNHWAWTTSAGGPENVSKCM